MPTLLIADDHPLFREALRGAVQRIMPGVQLFEADSVQALYALTDAHSDAAHSHAGECCAYFGDTAFD